MQGSNMKKRKVLTIAVGVLGILGGIIYVPLTLFLSLAATVGVEARSVDDSMRVTALGVVFAFLLISINIDLFATSLLALFHKGRIPARIGVALCIILLFLGFMAPGGWVFGILYLVGLVFFVVISFLQRERDGAPTE